VVVECLLRFLVVEDRGLEQVPSVARPGELSLPRQRAALLLLLDAPSERVLVMKIAERHCGHGRILVRNGGPDHPFDMPADALPATVLTQPRP